MLIALYFFIVNVVVPQIGAYAQSLLIPVMTIIILLAGIVILFKAVGITISNNFVSSALGGFFSITGYLCGMIFQAIGWIFRNTFRMIPCVFRESKKTFSELGLTTWISNILAVIVDIIFVVIII